MSDTFWLLCLHEAGHAAVALALGYRVTTVFARPDGGLSQDTATSMTDCALITAAAEAAEQLLSSEPPPERTERTAQQPARFATIATNDVIRMLTTPSGNDAPEPIPSDARQLALYAIDGIENEPERWTERLNFVKAYAARIVEQQRGKILILARELYQQHFISGRQMESLFAEEGTDK